MNILVISGEFPPFAGGAGTYCRYLVKALADVGHNVTLITKHYGKNAARETEIDKELAEQNINCIRMPYSKFTFMISWYNTISAFLKNNKAFDFIILNGNIAQLICCKPKLKKRLGKYITIQHGMSAYDSLKKSRLLTMFNMKRRLDILFGNAAANIAICKSLKDKLEQTVKMPNLRVILNCIDNKAFTLPAKAKNDDTLRLTTASRLIPGKNTTAVIKLFAKLRRDFSNLYLNVAGTGSESDKLKDEAESLQISRFVNFTGQLNTEDLCRLYQNSDVFILLSHYENLALVYLEANACGIPVIGSDVGGTKEAIDDGVTGFVVPLDNEKIIYEKTKLLLEDKSLRRKMGEAGKKRVDESFCLETLGKNFDNLLNELTTDN